MGLHSWRGAIAARGKPYTRSTILPQLCTNLVWLHEARGCINENP